MKKDNNNNNCINHNFNNNNIMKKVIPTIIWIKTSMYIVIHWTGK
jgi:hypothetical protein